MSFCWTRNPDAELVMERTLERLRGMLDVYPGRRSVRAVVLGGGYGRGEGGATADGKLYNDLDFYAVLNTGASRAAAATFFADASRELRAIARIDVDFCLIDDLKRFFAGSRTLMSQELFAGNVVVWGDEKVFADAPRIDFRDIPWREGARLLLNRGTGLLLALEQFASPRPDIDFIRRNINKAALGCGDAQLIARHSYKASGMERLKKLQFVKAEAELAIQYEGALMSKYTPDPDMHESLESLQLQHEVILQLFFNTLVEYSALVCGKAPADETAAVEQLCGMAPDRPVGYWRNAVLSLMYGWSTPELLLPLSEHPRLKLLRILVKSLVFRRGEAGYCRLWERFN